MPEILNFVCYTYFYEMTISDILCFDTGREQVVFNQNILSFH